MIIEAKKQLDIENIGADVKTIEAGIDASSMPFLFDMLSTSFYSNAISSICREITSNCCDSHTEANVDDPVIVKRGEDEEGTYVSFIDTGVGMNQYLIEEVYMNYFSSTKRDSNEQIGGFGLGSKSPFSYTDHFYINTISNKHTFIYNNVPCPFAKVDKVVTLRTYNYKYQYIFTKGITKPTIDLLFKSRTSEHTGTEIRIYLHDSSDIQSFRSALNKQLCYFDNVYFDNWSIDNDYTIFEGTYFKFRNKNQYDSKMHIVLDKVAYPIDWKQLGITEYNIAVGIKFQIGELLVTPNREQLRYTDEICKLVRDRIAKAVKELIDIFDQQNKGYDSYFEWISKKDEKPFIRFNNPNGRFEKLYLYGIDYITRKSQYKYLAGLESLSDTNILSMFYRYYGEIKDGKIKKEKYSYVYPEVEMRHHPSSCYIVDNIPITNDRNWLVYNGMLFVPIIKDRRDLRYLFYRGDYYGINPPNRINRPYFNLGSGLRYYKLLKAIREEINARCNHYRDLTPAEQLDYEAYKRENNRSLQKRLQGKVYVKSISEGVSYDWSLTTNTSDTTYWTRGINSYKGIVIYGFSEDQVKLKKALALLHSVRPKYFETNRGFIGNNLIFKVIQISKQNEKYFKNKPNMTHVDNLYSDNILFRDMASSFKLEHYFNDLESISSQLTREYINQLKHINSNVGETLQKLYNFYKNTTSRENRNFTYLRGEIKNEVLSIAKQYNLFNPEVENMLNYVNTWFKDIEIIRYMNLNSKTLPYVLKLLYEKKKKMNIEYYQRVLNTDPSVQLKLEFNDSEPIICTKLNSIINNGVL